MMGTVDPLSSASERFLGPSEQGSAVELGGGWDEAGLKDSWRKGLLECGCPGQMPFM